MAGDHECYGIDPAVHDRESIRASWEDDEPPATDQSWGRYFQWMPGYGWVPRPVPPHYKIDLTVADPRKT